MYSLERSGQVLILTGILSLIGCKTSEIKNNIHPPQEISQEHYQNESKLINYTDKENKRSPVVHEYIKINPLETKEEYEKRRIKELGYLPRVTLFFKYGVREKDIDIAHKKVMRIQGIKQK
jgi:hypothetical protein